jgi:hypothetical protein
VSRFYLAVRRPIVNCSGAEGVGEEAGDKDLLSDLLDHNEAAKSDKDGDVLLTVDPIALSPPDQPIHEGHAWGDLGVLGALQNQGQSSSSSSSGGPSVPHVPPPTPLLDVGLAAGAK